MAGSLLEGIAQEKGGIKGGYRGVSQGDPEDRKKKIKIVGSIAAVILAAILLTIQLRSGGDPAAETSNVTLIDSKTKELFRVKLLPGTHPPFINPSTGQKTLFRTERCFWTKDGKAKLNPTHVLLNEHIGINEPTICPDCGRPVRLHNPIPPAELLDEAIKANRKE
ncbi:MAG: hypothetical protein LW822_09800 [Phycisphaeraceae bacterium]|jgi:hypothetical protein|nr:hypothetical protein [Phycisphaeraceae bacterium]